MSDDDDSIRWMKERLYGLAQQANQRLEQAGYEQRLQAYEGMAVQAAAANMAARANQFMLAKAQRETPAVTVESSWRDKYAALADKAGSLRTERDELLRENAQLRRKLERATRTGSKADG